MSQSKCIVYVSNADSGDIHVFDLVAPTGELTFVQKVSTDGVPMPLAISPDKRFLFAMNRMEPHAAVSFAIDPRDGRLSRIASSAQPHRLAYIATDRSGKFLLGASYSDHKLTVSAIDAQGAVQAPHQIVDVPPHAHAILADPSNQYVLASSLGGDVVLQYRFDAQRGHLTPNDPPSAPFPAKAGPRHFVFHPSARFVYVINELDATVSMTRFDASRGTLTVEQTLPLLPPGFAGKPWAAEIRPTRDGRFLYTAERSSSTLAAFAVDAQSGRLTPVGTYPTEEQPRGFNIDPSGRYLFAVGQNSHRLSVHAIEADGALRKLYDYPVGQNPTWVEVLSL